MITTYNAFARLTQLAQPSVAAVAPKGLSALPYPMRFVLADVLAQIVAGERAALACARRVAVEDPRADAREMALTQVRDEQRHLAFFQNALDQLGVPQRAMANLQLMFDDAEQAPDLPSLLIGTHLVVEPLAHELFRDLAKILASVAGCRALPRSWSAPINALAVGLATIDADESRHIAFGALRLRALRETASPIARERIDAIARSWRERMLTTLIGLPVLPPLRPWFRKRVRKVVCQFDARLADSGIQ